MYEVKHSHPVAVWVVGKGMGAGCEDCGGVAYGFPVQAAKA